MELEKDYILRMIKDLTKSIAHLVLGKSEIEYELPQKTEFTDTDYLYVKLLEMVGSGHINEAENLLFNEMNTTDFIDFEMAISFYLYLNDFGDDFLEKYNYSRDEIKEGIRDICEEFNVSTLVEFLF